MPVVLTVLDHLIQQLNDLGTALNQLHQFTEDFEEETSPLLVGNIRDETLEIISWHRSCLNEAEKARTALEQQKNLESARNCLAGCNEFFGEMFNRFFTELFTPEHVIDLERFQKKKETMHWAHTTLKDLYRCQVAIQKVCAGLLASWKFLFDSLIISQPRVNSTSSGQWS